MCPVSSFWFCRYFIVACLNIVIHANLKCKIYSRSARLKLDESVVVYDNRWLLRRSCLSMCHSNSDRTISTRHILGRRILHSWQSYLLPVLCLQVCILTPSVFSTSRYVTTYFSICIRLYYHNGLALKTLKPFGPLRYEHWEQSLMEGDNLLIRFYLTITVMESQCQIYCRNAVFPRIAINSTKPKRVRD